MNGAFSRISSLLCLLCLPLLMACPRQPTITELPPASFEKYWQAYAEQAKQAEERRTAFRMKATVQYETPDNNGHRMNALIWGNPDLPVRMDLNAGIGVLVAQVREDKHHFLLHMTEEKTAYAHQGSNKPFFSIGTPLPFTLELLIYLMNGRFGPVFGYEAGILQSSQGSRYVLGAKAPAQGVLSLSQKGLPLAWDGSPPSGMPGGQGYGWTMDMDYAEEDPFLPRRLILKHNKGYSATIHIRGRETLDELFPAGRLALELPPQTAVHPLDAQRE